MRARLPRAGSNSGLQKNFQVIEEALGGFVKVSPAGSGGGGGAAGDGVWSHPRGRALMAAPGPSWKGGSLYDIRLGEQALAGSQGSAVALLRGPVRSLQPGAAVVHQDVQRFSKVDAGCASQAARKKARVEGPPTGGSVLGFLSPALVHALEPLAATLRGATMLGSAPPERACLGLVPAAHSRHICCQCSCHECSSIGERWLAIRSVPAGAA